CAAGIEEDMRPGDVPPGAGTAHPGDECGYTGADIGTDGYRYAQLDGDALSGCEAHRHRNDSCTAVDKRGDRGAGDDSPQQTVLRLEHKPGEQTSGLQGWPDGLHDLDAE